jgi:hypothetical protein
MVDGSLRSSGALSCLKPDGRDGRTGAGADGVGAGGADVGAGKAGADRAAGGGGVPLPICLEWAGYDPGVAVGIAAAACSTVHASGVATWTAMALRAAATSS